MSEHNDATKRVDAGSLREAIRLDLLHLLPNGRDVGHSKPRAVHEVQIHILHTELTTAWKVQARILDGDERSHPFHAVVDGRVHVETIPARELRRDIHVLPSKATVLQGRTSLLLVPVGLGGV